MVQHKLQRSSERDVGSLIILEKAVYQTSKKLLYQTSKKLLYQIKK